MSEKQKGFLLEKKNVLGIVVPLSNSITGSMWI